jgi:HD-like signal output (HDOD) protein
MGEMATLPEVSAKVLRIVNSPGGSPRELHELIRHDPALSALVLRAVNSAFYGFPGQIVSLDRAIILLGFAAVRNIALTPSLSRMFGHGPESGPFPPRELWRHSVAVGLAAKGLVGFQRESADPDEMFLIGLIHDLGLVIERQAFPSELAMVLDCCEERQGGLLELEERIIGASHQELGEALMAKWRFPRSLRTIVAHHHDPGHLPEEYQRRGWILRVADLLSCEIGIGTALAERGPELTEAVLASAGIEIEQFEEVKLRLPQEVSEAVAIFGWDRG